MNNSPSSWRFRTRAALTLCLRWCSFTLRCACAYYGGVSWRGLCQIKSGVLCRALQLTPVAPVLHAGFGHQD